MDSSVGSFSSTTRVDKALLSNLSLLRSRVPSSEPLRRVATDQVISGCLVASYLSHRGILTSTHIFTLAQKNSLQEVLEAGPVFTAALFEGLAEHFNGDVFGSVPAALEVLTPQELLTISSFLQGDDLSTGQQTLYPYDFSVLPSDLVSSIYEQLLEADRRAQGAYYTPRFLVDLILDEVVPWVGNLRPRLIDLACGSGAFMTQAFRRMAYQERQAKGRRLSYDELQTLLLEKIFGVEQNPDAARIAAFGLYLALLEELDPPTVWREAVLPKLIGRNLVVSDAFANHSLADEKFDAVVSNPPWTSSLTPAAIKFISERNLPVADRQLAQAFLWLAKECLSETGKLGLVMPAKPLLHNRSAKASEFRRELFRQLDVSALIDLSAVRRMIFATAIAPAAVVIAEVKPGNRAPGESQAHLIHVAAHPRSVNSAIDALQVTPEEVRSIPVSMAENRADLWKILLWGSLRDLQFIDWLRATFPTVQDWASKKGWVAGQGYQPAGGDQNDASHMFGLPIISGNDVLPLALGSSAGDSIFDVPYLHRPRNPRLFQAPHVLIRTTFVRGRLAATLVERDAVFRHGVMGVAGPAEDKPLLTMLAATICSSLGHYYLFMTSAAWGVERDFVELNEHLGLPLAEPNAAQFARLQDILAESDGLMTEHFRRSLDEVVFDVYGLTQPERDRVMEGLQYGIERFRRPTQFYDAVSPDQIQDYETQLRATVTRFLPDTTVSSFNDANGYFRAVALTIESERSDRRRTEGGTGRRIDVEAIVRQAERELPPSMGIVAQPAGFMVDEDTIYIVKTADRDRWTTDAALDDGERIIAALAFGGSVA
ncbi:HsdM family class I SAM-dependent methyltransferase [Paractinoplanes lichenicola]|nr:N-6 DNA methylase [Actinoplanes lichenicola]